MTWPDASYAVCDTDGAPMCWHCGDAAPTIDGKWCCHQHRIAGRHMLRCSPTPAEIRRECLRIQAGWTKSDRRKRLGTVPAAWTAPVVSVTDMEADTTVDALEHRFRWP